ncbi:MAG: PD40 domain-containing protein [Nitrospiraceae bacterium]|nr:MAG: PD40 domain-containing protein [Nitrospiraceae bacterium]
MNTNIRLQITDCRLQTIDSRLETYTGKALRTDNTHKFFLFFVCVLYSVFFVLSNADAKIYIDITSPGIRQLPVTVTAKGTARAKELEWIAKADLEATGMFSFVDPDVPGAEIIADMDVDTHNGLQVVLSVIDQIEGREVLKKRYDASKLIIRPMAHSIANDIYKVATGKKGVFRTRITYLSTLPSGNKGISLMDWDGFNSVRIVTRGLNSSHSWTQDGKYLLFSAERNRKWRIYILDLKTLKESILYSSKGLNLVGGTSTDGLVSFSSSRDGSSEIYSINTFGKKMKKLTRSFGIDLSPVFSPDGEKIAFVSDRSGGPQIYTMDANGKSINRLTFEGSYNTSPAWSPDNKWLAYSGRIDGKNQIFVVKSDGSETWQITMTGNNESPSYSPDGLFLAFDSDRDGERSIYIMRNTGEGQRRITKKGSQAMSPRWSPYFNE